MPSTVSVRSAKIRCGGFTSSRNSTDLISIRAPATASAKVSEEEAIGQGVLTSKRNHPDGSHPDECGFETSVLAALEMVDRAGRSMAVVVDVSFVRRASECAGTLIGLSACP